MTKVHLPTVLRQYAEGLRCVEVEGANIDEVLGALVAKHPDLKSQLLDGDSGLLKNYVNIFINDTNIRDRDDQDTLVSAGDEILIVPALAGG
ncbi:MAG: MoaD/ThiS family protein [Pirellulales bacterium]|nr:MoaD/ThiS family protein [Pirellulales bacterium]